MVFEGDMWKGEKHGKGTLTFRSGDEYSGEFKNGQMTGQGKE